MTHFNEQFIHIEEMSPAEYRDKGKGLSICYSSFDSPFGKVLIASTGKGVCFTAFGEDGEFSLAELKKEFPAASFQLRSDDDQQKAVQIFEVDWNRLTEIRLHLRGSAFQFMVWRELLKIPRGMLTTYGEIARKLGKPGASRAVGTANGANPVSFLIPCHRVVQSSGYLGGYRWGLTLKSEMIDWERSR